ncbi:uncharacterized protein LOC144577547 [Callithrix jacchus]
MLIHVLDRVLWACQACCFCFLQPKTLGWNFGTVSQVTSVGEVTKEECPGGMRLWPEALGLGTLKSGWWAGGDKTSREWPRTWLGPENPMGRIHSYLQTPFSEDFSFKG